MTAEQEFWSTLDLSGMTVYDAGAFHRLLTLFFASRAKQVISFEPNSRNRRRLMENLALNGVKNVMVCESGLGSRRELLKMATSRLMPGGASVDTEIVAEVERSGQGAVVEEIQIVPLDEEIREAGLPKPDFIKIDIEGFELEALQGARQTIKLYQPALFLEMHGETIREKKRRAVAIVEFLREVGYRRIIHIESGAAITAENAIAAMQGHLYCPPIVRGDAKAKGAR